MRDTARLPILSVKDITHIGHDLDRPESVHVTADGGLLVSHRARGISRIAPDGQIETRGPAPAIANGAELVPNGIAPQPDGSVLIANIGEGGGIWRLGTDQALTLEVMEAEGVPLAAANFVMTDDSGRMWITVSTVQQPRFNAYSDKVADGLIVLVENGKARILADDICFANECRLTPDGTGLVISETFSRRITRFDLGPDGLSNRRTLVQFGRGDFPDGIRYDRAGHLWVTCIVSNRLWRVAPDGQAQLVLEDCDEALVDRVESALAEGRMGREHFYDTGDSRLGNIASIAFSTDESRAFLGSLCGTSILSIPVPQGDQA
ncbi:SMP-30/gluconolactonase/LRE family protein [Pseudooceanicola sp. HF7]|uniref:SMP-30/gluconolactonase/LRE family protein n=1 Tax=Pseudooceanicola sp. HF7 TaxID=2721560 RepID=UPI001431CC9B|nr:SMP-30/gluconolactonase/LRE family protein [Pseudooceanicola sp. HF7]NIZ11717.1 SMP-30/gluconolactonase/LRE family protein [Pseudooceanicola sp. HF7]